MLTEATQSKEMLRDFAALTGGVSLVDSNDTLGGIDVAMRDASSHYVLSYEPVTPPKATEHRSIDVKVRRPGRAGAGAARLRRAVAKPIQPMKVPEAFHHNYVPCSLV